MSLQPDAREQAVRDRIEWSQVAGLGAAVLWSSHEIAHLLRVIDGLRAGAVRLVDPPEAARLILNSGLEVEPHVHAWLVTLADQP